MSFGEKVQLLIKNNNISQEKLANLLRINRNYLSRIETGKSEPSLSVIKSIANIFKTDVASLIGIGSNSESSEDKIKEINDSCKYLLDSDLDLVLRIISILREEYVKRDTGSN